MNPGVASLRVLAVSFLSLAAASAGAEARPAQEQDLARLIAERSGFPGGLCVVVGAGEVQGAIELGRTGRWLIQVLDGNAASVDAACEAIRQAGLYGLVTADLLPAGGGLPYAENLVNAVVFARASAPAVAPTEAARVLCPRGVVLIPGREASPAAKAAGLEADGPAAAGGWMLARKPWPAGMDEWTHPRHSAAGNAVSLDRMVGPPRRVRWVAGPSDKEISSAISAGGRNYYGGIWARDSFNGLRLWERALTPSPALGNFSYRKTAGSVPPVAAGGRLYAVTDGVLVAMDGATGRILREYGDAGTPMAILHVDGALIACDLNTVLALDAESGKLKWQRRSREPQCMVAGEGGVFYLEGSARRGEALSVICLDVATGRVRWRKEDGGFLAKVRRCVVGQGVLVLEVSTISDIKQGNAIHVVDTSDGRLLWSRPFVPGAMHMKQARAMIVGDTLWVLQRLRAVALDPRTGQEKRSIPAGEVHCFPPVTTVRYMFSGEMELTDLETGELDACRISKAACSRDAGWMPANGLINLCPKHCVCWPMVQGYVALAPQRAGAAPPREPTKADFRPERGPASAPAAPAAADGPWPCYRHDEWRSSATATSVAGEPAELRPLWTADLGGRPNGPIAQDWREDPFVRGSVTAPVIAGGMVYVARPDAHEVVALDAAGGQVRWRFTANGRIDTPPTFHRGMCLFGTAAGWAYGLRAGDGRMVWRLRAAPHEERIVAYGQVESPWPVAGALLAADGVAYFAAGRHPLAEGGILALAVESASGQVRWVSRLDSIASIHFGKYRVDPNEPDVTTTHTTLYLCNALEFDHIDLLAREGSSVAMSRWLFDRATGQMTAKPTEAFALLAMGGGEVVVPRGPWSYAPRSQPRVAGEVPTRPLVVWRDSTLFGCLDDRQTVYRRDFAAGEAATFDRSWITGWAQSDNARKKTGELWRSDRLSAGAAWKVRVLDEKQPAHRIGAMVLAGDKLYVVGSQGGLTVLSAGDGKPLGRCEAPAPAWDGLAVGAGKLVLSTQDGRVVCLGKGG